MNVHTGVVSTELLADIPATHEQQSLQGEPPMSTEQPIDTTTRPWWKEPRNITWMGILAVFLIAGILIAFGLRGSLQPAAAPTDGYVDVEEIEELVEANNVGDFEIPQEVLDAGYKIPTYGPFCDDEGNTLTTWERIDIVESFDADVWVDAFGDTERGSDVRVIDNSYAPRWVTNPQHFYFLRTTNPIIDIASLTVDGTHQGMDATAPVDLTAYTDPGATAVFVEDCYPIEGLATSQAFAFEDAPILHRLNDDGSVNIAQTHLPEEDSPHEGPLPFFAVSYLGEPFVFQTMPIAFFIDTSDAEIMAVEAAGLSDYQVPADSLNYFWATGPEGVLGQEIFLGYDREPLYVRALTAPPAGSLDLGFGNLVTVPQESLVKPETMFTDGFCFGAQLTDRVITRTANPEGMDASVYITEITEGDTDTDAPEFSDMWGLDFGPCPWVFTTVIDQ